MDTSSPYEVFVKKYDAWYDSEEGKILYENEKKCIEPLIKSCDKVLEVGVGTGRFALLAKHAVGIDIAFFPLKMAKKRGVWVIQAKAEELPFKDKSFECVMFVLSLSFIKDGFKSLLEAKRVLKEQGKIIICEVFKGSKLGKVYEEKKQKGHPFYSHANFYDFIEFKKMLEACGLRIAKAYGTLVNYPCKPVRLEDPSEISFDTQVLAQLPGFVCLEVRP
ncbi:methyltransferase domain-containing protein [Thermodesulfobacterium sp. TA1]|uniref:class I SAM-dependent methyltransferase n=1 Tax=Thermodesulfobacterium sp. TA1 TaxID=2234087 RepID=UPI001232B3D2|nr:class I SAM-dependent methyltransferase [Thermodesulfobacterium sp. TA1]QER41644.1 methyltransferase domain-containing protein [Thermodesulfobacterium sp. TA1]